MARTIESFVPYPHAVALGNRGEPEHCVIDYLGHKVDISNSEGELLARMQRVVYIDDGVTKYDEMLRMERGGSIFLPVQDGLVGLRKVWRPQTTDPDYRKTFPNVDLSQCGQMAWDACGGYGDPDKTEEEQAIAEAEEESQGMVLSCEYLGKIAMNRGSDTHFTFLFAGTVDLKRRGNVEKDPFEKFVGNMKFFGKRAVDQLFEAGEFYDAAVIAAIWRYDRKYHGRLLA